MSAPLPPTVITSGGPIFGSHLPAGFDALPVNQYLGVPFARPTRRFEPPVDFEGRYHSNPLNATMWGAACLQVGGNASATSYGSEDCLRANVWQPSPPPAAAATPGKPVMVFIYGGSNQFGEAEPYNMSGLAAYHDVVCVNFNYRTGPIGWMAFDSDAASNATTGNYGILDIQSALRWVRREIGHFGGDRHRVAIHGQSSGGGLVELQLVAPASNGLFRAAISESGGLSARTLGDALAATFAVANATGCLRRDRTSGKAYASKICMQLLPALAITSLTDSGDWGPTVDGVTIPGEPMKLLERGLVNDRVEAAVMGHQTNDSFLFLARDGYTRNHDTQPNWRIDGDLVHLNSSEYAEALQSLYYFPTAKVAARALALYPPFEPTPGSPPPSPTDLIRNVQSLGRAQSDFAHCGNRRRARLFARGAPVSASAANATATAEVAQGSPRRRRAYVYRFNSWYRSNAACTAVPNYHLDYLGAVHQDEVTFVMGQPNFMESGSCCGVWGLSEGEESCAKEPKCTRCYDPAAFGEGYHAYFDDKEFRFSRVVGGLWTGFAATGQSMPRYATVEGVASLASPTSRQGPRLNGDDDEKEEATAAAAPTWPDISGGGVVLDADLPAGLAVEEQLYGNAAVCELWDEVWRSNRGARA